MQTSSQIAKSLSELMKVEQFQGVSEQFSQELMKVIIQFSFTNEKKNFI
jgi:hypothetical protein